MEHDVAIIGAGVVGCAIARRFALEGARVALIEAGGDILSGASKANSAILHTGFDAPPGSIELQCIRDGHQEYLEIRDAFRLPLLRTGALVVAWNEAEEQVLTAIHRTGIENGVTNVELIGRDRLHEMEPNIARSARAAVWVPDESLIDPWSPFLAYVEQALMHGATVRFNAKVTGGAFEDGRWRLLTTRGDVTARHVINCAGNQGDRIEELLLGHAEFQIRPRKGQFVVFDKAAAGLINSIILPVPNERTKGVVVTRTIFGNLLVGPTAEEQNDRDHAEVDHAQLEALVRKGIEIVPGLADMPITATYAGLRPASEKKDFRIFPRPERNWITVGGIRSTGLSAALGIARHVFGLYAGMAGRSVPDVERAGGRGTPSSPQRGEVPSEGEAMRGPSDTPFVRGAPSSQAQLVVPGPSGHLLPAGEKREQAANPLLSYATAMIPVSDPHIPTVPNLAEHLPRDYATPGYGEIICHCEMVTRREIETALSRLLPAGDFGGLKRRTRCAMGRCQGFNCSARLAAMTRGRFETPLDAGDAA